jgi:hypothetical protein
VLVLRKKVGGRQAYRDESGDPRGDSSDGEITETERSQPMSVDQLFHDTAGWKVRNVALGPGNGLFLLLCPEAGHAYQGGAQACLVVWGFANSCFVFSTRRRRRPMP